MGLLIGVFLVGLAIQLCLGIWAVFSNLIQRHNIFLALGSLHIALLIGLSPICIPLLSIGFLQAIPVVHDYYLSQLLLPAVVRDLLEAEVYIRR